MGVKIKQRANNKRDTRLETTRKPRWTKRHGGPVKSKVQVKTSDTQKKHHKQEKFNKKVKFSKQRNSKETEKSEEREEKDDEEAVQDQSEQEDDSDAQVEPPTKEEANNIGKPDRSKREKKKLFDFEKNNRSVFVGNLPINLDHREVAKLFKDCGEVESARIRSIVPEKEKMPPKAAIIKGKIHPKVDSFNAYVVFKSADSIEKALKMNATVVDGHQIRVDRAARPKAKRETLTSRKKSIFVGNLKFDIRDDDLINHFKDKVGQVNYVRIVRDSATGLGKGFGFVVFNERASVKKALELNETKFMGRELRIKKVDEKTKKK